jgi:hypothetical protein
MALDFIGPLPTENGKDTILTMMDPLGADICIAATHSMDSAAKIAIVLFDEWYCENGLMLHLVSDWDPLFTADIWTALHKLTGAEFYTPPQIPGGIPVVLGESR